MEGSIFRKPYVAKLLDRFVEVRLHTDRPNDADSKRFKEYQATLVGSIGLPIYAVVDPEKPHELLGVFEGADPSRGKRFSEWLEKRSKVDPS